MDHNFILTVGIWACVVAGSEWLLGSLGTRTVFTPINHLQKAVTFTILAGFAFFVRFG